MSRSYKHTPISGRTSAKSEKLYKVFWHRQERAAARMALCRGDEAGLLLIPYDDWAGPKDGKCYLDKVTLAKYPKSMRK